MVLFDSLTLNMKVGVGLVGELAYSIHQPEQPPSEILFFFS